MNCTDDKITDTPNMTGPCGRAWLVDPKKVQEAHPELVKDLAWQTQIGSWMIEAPFAHPVWHTYHFSLISLKDVPGMASATLYFEGAQYELVIHALDPDKPRDQALKDNCMRQHLTPANFAAQFTADHDAAAMQRVERDIQMVIDGQLSPDTDYQRVWIEKYGNAMIKAEYR